MIRSQSFGARSQLVALTLVFAFPALASHRDAALGAVCVISQSGALVSPATDAVDDRRVPELGPVIAQQGNVALQTIRAELRREMLASALHTLPAPDAPPAALAFGGATGTVALFAACPIWSP